MSAFRADRDLTVEITGLVRESPGLVWESPGLVWESPGLVRESPDLGDAPSHGRVRRDTGAP